MTVYFPIVYVRGYAMTANAVEETFNLPYYGFNLGATQHRQGSGRDPEMHIFESPVIRLMKDHGYTDAFGRFATIEGDPIPESVPASIDWRRTLWVFRYYDREARLFNEDRPPFPQYALRLLAFLNKVRIACGRPPEFAVNLVAHSMGGLISRCYLQNPRFFSDVADAASNPDEDPEHLQVVRVNKLFTYGTPHRGIRFRGALGPVNALKDVTGAWREDQFTPKYMRVYLGLRDDEEPHIYHPQAHAPAREATFSLVGTNAADYVTRGSSMAVGVKSDGLVLTENAYIHGGPRAYVYKAHSGPLGLVNSEEGYQNLRRFLFGNLRYQLRLVFGSVVDRLPNTDSRDELERLTVDLAVAIRGLSGYLDARGEQAFTAEEVPLRMQDEHFVPSGEADPVLHTGYLFAFHDHRRGFRAASRDLYSRWLLDIVIRPHYRRFGLLRTSRFEGDQFLADRLELALGDDTADKPFLYRWQNQMTQTKEPEIVTAPDSALQRYRVALPGAAQRYLKDVYLVIDVQDLRPDEGAGNGAGG